MDRPDLQLNSAFGPFSPSLLRILRAYLLVTTGLYVLGVAATVFPVTDIPLANPTGGFIAIALGIAALAWLAYRPTSPTPATLAACVATPIVIAFHVLINAQLLCLIAVLFLAMYVRVSYRQTIAWLLVGALTVSSVAALIVSPAPTTTFLCVIVALAVPAAAETFGLLTRSLIVAACTDPLTGALNRAGWDVATTTLLAAERSTPATIAVIAIDVDDFKSLNDTHGHAAGDRFLTELVRTAADALPRRAIIARLGGDEFAICIADTAASPIAPLLDTIHSALPRTTLGSATAPAASADIGELLARADAQLARGKHDRKR